MNKSIKHPEYNQSSIGKRVRVCTGLCETDELVGGITNLFQLKALNGIEGYIVLVGSGAFKISGKAAWWFSSEMLELIEEDNPETIPPEIYVFQNIAEKLSKDSGVSEEVKEASLIGKKCICKLTRTEGLIVCLYQSCGNYVWINFCHTPEKNRLYHIRNIMIID